MDEKDNENSLCSEVDRLKWAIIIDIRKTKKCCNGTLEIVK